MDVPGPAPETVAAAEIGCAYGGVAAAAARGAPAPERKKTHAECFPASDPFMEGFFPLHFFLDSANERNGFSLKKVALVSDPKYQTQISFEYVARARARALAPTAAHAGGGAVVFVSGADLRRDEHSALVCALASSASASPFAAAVPVAVAVSSALVACETPTSLPAGAHAARVALAGADAFGVGASASAAATLVATPPPTIRDVSPVSVTPHGGARVTLTGARLRAVSAEDSLAATFGTFAPVALTPGSASEGAFAAPARRPSANVAVGARRSPAESNHARMPPGFAFEVVAPFTPLREGVVPSAAPVARETEGAASDASGGAIVFVALAPPRFFAASRGGAAAVAPSFFATPRAGFAAVSALAPLAGHDGARANPRARARRSRPSFLSPPPRREPPDPPRSSSFAPRRARRVHPGLAVEARARAGGGSVLDVSGADFARMQTRVRFGSAASGDGAGSAAYVVSSAYLRVEVFGDHAPGARVPLDLASTPEPPASSGVAFVSGGAAVEARAAPAVFRARPAFGSEEGGVAVALTGTSFRDTGAYLKCRFGSVAVTASSYAPTRTASSASPRRARRRRRRRSRFPARRWR